MFKFSAALVGLLVAPSLYAQTACKTPSLHDFTVYSVGNIDVQQSDYQGLTGAGGFVMARNFQFNTNPATCLALTAGQDLGISSAAILGNTEAGGTAGINSTGARGDVTAKGAFINSSSVRGNLITTETPKVQSSGIGGLRKKLKSLGLRTDHAAISNELQIESVKHSYTASNNTATVQDDALVFELKSGENRFTLLNPKALTEAKTIYILGDASSSAVINIPGDSIMLESQNIIIDRNIRPSNITWNFYQATYLHLSHTHNAKLGMPGIVMAPKAVVEFNEALITGALYAGEIVTSLTPYTTLNAGQVNVDPTNPSTPVPPPPAPAPKPN